MPESLLFDGKVYRQYQYNSENEFEKVIVQQVGFLFGEQSIYIDIKKRIGSSIVTIPDGYLIDSSFPAEPRLYIIENELSSHDPYKHIGSQLLKFAISYKATGRKIKAFLLEHIMQNKALARQTEAIFERAGYRNIDDFLESIIFEKPVAAIVVIDQTSDELENVLSQLTMDTDILEFQTFSNDSGVIHKYTPFNAEIRELKDEKGTLSPDVLDTIVIPAREDGFENEFLSTKRWYAIRIHASMIDKIKYIAAYQVAPISAITHYAEVASIEKWADTNKYVVHFKDQPTQITPVKLDKNKKGLAPQAPRYSSLDRILKARKLSDVF